MADEEVGGDSNAASLSSRPVGFLKWSSAGVAATDALEAWIQVVNSTDAKYAVKVSDPDNFHGAVSRMDFGEFTLAVAESVEQTLIRTDRQVALDNAAILGMGLVVGGRVQVEQAGRTSDLGPGDFTFVDHLRPFQFSLVEPSTLIFVDQPLAVVRDLVPSRVLEVCTGVRMPGSGPTGIVSSFVTSLVELAKDDPVTASALGAHLPHLLASTICVAHGVQPTEETRDAFAREEVLAFLRANLTDPSLDAGQIATACRISRRTLYRLFQDAEGQSVMATLRRMRVHRAQEMLLASQDRTVDAIARACGFSGERQFHRVFRQATGTSPAQFRADSVRGG